jgi:hypothetical protein
MTYALRSKLTVKTTNIICKPPALVTFTISFIAFRALFPLAEIFFCRSACLSGQTGGGQSRGQTVQLVQNFKGLPNQNYCS